MDRRSFLEPGNYHYLLVDLDSREPLSEKEALALSDTVGQLVEERLILNETIRKVNQRLILSGEAKVKEMVRDSFITREGAIWEVAPSGPCPDEDSR